MLGITYKRDNSLVWACEDIGKYELNPNNWTSHQTPALAMALGVLSLVLLIEKLIIQDLFYYYQNIKNTKITSDFILPHGYQAPILSYNKASLMAKTKLQKSHINIGWSNLFNELTTLRRLRLQSKFWNHGTWTIFWGLQAGSRLRPYWVTRYHRGYLCSLARSELGEFCVTSAFAPAICLTLEIIRWRCHHICSKEIGVIIK